MRCRDPPCRSRGGRTEAVVAILSPSLPLPTTLAAGAGLPSHLLLNRERPSSLAACAAEVARAAASSFQAGIGGCEGSGDVGGRTGGRRSGGSGRGKSRGAGDAAGERKRSAGAAARPPPPHSPIEIIKLCFDFLNADTDTTSTMLRWIMAKLVKNPSIQSKIHDKIMAKTGDEKVEVSKEDVHGMPYLRAVVLEGLRKHPPGHFMLPQKAMEDMEVGGYLIPKGATVNFMVAEISRDEQEWAKPMEFIPKRFLPDGDSKGVDVTGNKGIRMMPFGVKRRICVGLNFAMHHLGYFVANMVREFK
uniref:Cytochrome P450 n=1 Tax=Oryza glumipatula TaxID=40148 RepID=A0A0E0AC57_9ORYZ